MKIQKKGNVLSATGKTKIIILMISTGLIIFGIGIYFFSSNIFGRIISFSSAFLSIGAISLLFTKIIMHPDKLEIQTLFENRILAKDSMQKVTWGRGVGVSLQLKDGSMVKIPDLGNSQSVCNSIRAWMKRA